MVHIYRHLTKPFRFLIFTVEEFLVPLFILTLFYLLQMGILGLLVAAMSYTVLRKWNQTFGEGIFKKGLYWYGLVKVGPTIPPSTWREYL